jgi:hypothetical protein
MIFANNMKNIKKHTLLVIKKKATRIPSLHASEIITIILLFHYSPAKNFKYFYTSYLQNYRSELPNLVSYNRFIELQQRYFTHFCWFLKMIFDMNINNQTGINYIDATCIPVCHNKRTSRHKVFKGFAALGKSSMGWFFGIKLHLIINEKGDLLRAQLTPGNVDDRKPVRQMTSRLFGLALFGRV